MSAPKDEYVSRLEKIAESLLEFYDSIQIVATRHDPSGEGSLSYSVGRGDHYARIGALHDLYLKENERSRMAARRESEEEP